MPSCRPTHTHTHPPCHLAARHRSEPCPPAPASRCTATLHFRCPAAVLMRKPAPERKPELKPGQDPPYGNTPRNRRFRRAFPSAHGARHHRPTPHHRTARSAFPSANNRRRSPPPTHTHTRSRPGTRISPGTRIQPKTIRPRRHAAPPPRRSAAPPPHAVARHLTVPLRQTHARTKKRSTLADASPLFGNVEFVTRPERNACRQLR